MDFWNPSSHYISPACQKAVSFPYHGCCCSIKEDWVPVDELTYCHRPATKKEILHVHGYLLQCGIQPHSSVVGAEEGKKRTTECVKQKGMKNTMEPVCCIASGS